MGGGWPNSKGQTVPGSIFPLSTKENDDPDPISRIGKSKGKQPKREISTATIRNEYISKQIKVLGTYMLWKEFKTAFDIFLHHVRVFGQYRNSVQSNEMSWQPY
jgi:hypothetical protein